MSNYAFALNYFNDSVQLKIWNRYGEILNQFYPQTFTVEECLEDWCVDQGYGFVGHAFTNKYDGTLVGTFDFVKPPQDKIVFSTMVVGGPL